MDTTQTATKYQAYSKYKPSGIDWLGDIPEGWEDWKVGHLFNKIGSGTTPPSENMDYYEGDIPWVITGELKDNEIFDSENKVTKKAVQELSALKIFPKNSLLIAMYGATIGKMAILRIPATTNQACCILGDSKLIDINFAFFYFLAFRPHLTALSYGGGQPNISQDIIKSIKIFLPTFTEQKEIVAFLDREMAKIDKVVAKKQKLIELLLEKRQAIISQAVTKGLNPKAKMKDSGIPWLGEIPESWTIKRLRFVCKTNTPRSEYKGDKDIEITFLAMESVGENGEINIEDIRKIEEVYNGYTYFIDEDILIAKITPCFENGKGAYVSGLTNGLGFGSTEFHVLRANRLVLPEYLYFITYSHPFRKIGEALMEGAAGQKRIPEDFIKNFTIGIPSIEEQINIINEIKNKSKIIQTLVNKIKLQNQKLQEFRQVLISNIVTGKVKVN